jgi:HEAT repeat protein
MARLSGPALKRPGYSKIGNDHFHHNPFVLKDLRISLAAMSSNLAEKRLGQRPAPWRPLWLLLLLAFLSQGAAEPPTDWQKRLSDPAPAVRDQAEKALLDMGAGAVPLCIELASTPSTSSTPSTAAPFASLPAQLSAVRTLRKLAQQGLVKPEHRDMLAKLQKSDNPEVRSAYYSLLPYVEEQPVAALPTALEDPDRAVKAAALRQLALVKQPFDPKACLRALETVQAEDPLAPLLLAALKAASPSAETAPVERLLQSSDPRLAALAAEVLGAWKAASKASIVANVGFSSKPAGVRTACFAALGRMGDPGFEAVETRASAAEGPVREQAAEALGHFAQSVPLLLKLLSEDPYSRVRQAASRSLQRIERLEANSDYFLPYDATPADQEKVIARWKAHFKERTGQEGTNKGN